MVLDEGPRGFGKLCRQPAAPPAISHGKTSRLPSVHVAELLVPPQGRDSCGDMHCKCSVTANSAGQLLGFVAVTGVDLD